MKPYHPHLTKQDIEASEIELRDRAEFFMSKGFDILQIRNEMIRCADFAQSKVLEIGTGGGYTTIVLTQMGFDVVSIDPSEEMLKKSAARLEARKTLDKAVFFKMDGSSMGFGNGEFSSVVAINVFHHIPNIKEMLSEIDRVVGPRGKVLLADFNDSGMKMVDDMHKSEGRVHEDCKVKEEDVLAYFSVLDYEVVRYPRKHHWVLVGQKKEILR